MSRLDRLPAFVLLVAALAPAAFGADLARARLGKASGSEIYAVVDGRPRLARRGVAAAR